MNGTVLIVDDEPGVRDGLRRLLLGDGYQVHTTGEGRQALTLFEQLDIDILLLDLDMPDMDGLQVCKAFRHLPRTQHVPVLFLTGSHNNDAYDQAIAAGADDFLAKPARWPELRMRVRSLVRLGQSHRAHQAAQAAVMAQQVRLDADELFRAHLRDFFLHELQIPLARIRQEAETRADAAHLSDGWSSVYEHADHCLHLVAGWTDALTTMEGRLIPKAEPWEVTNILRMQFEGFRRRLETKRVSWSLPSSEHQGHVLLDKALFNRVMTHLIDLLLHPSVRHISCLVEQPASSGQGFALQLLAEPPVESAPPEHHPESFSPAWLFCQYAMESMGGSVHAIRSNTSFGFELSLPVADAR